MSAGFNATQREIEILEVRKENARLREALKFARKRIEYYGTMVARRHFDHDLAEVYPRIDAALNHPQEIIEK